MIDYTQCFSLPAKDFGCTEHTYFADCLIALGNKHHKIIKQWMHNFKIVTDGRIKKFPEQDDKMIFDWCRRRDNREKAPDWSLLECGCPMFRWWTCISALRKLERSKYSSCEGQQVWIEQTRPLLEMGWNETSVMELFHKEMSEYWPLYSKHAAIRPRWRISILETYIDHADLILPLHWSANAMAAISLLQYDRFTKLLYLNAILDSEDRYLAARIFNATAKHPELEDYSAHRPHIHDVPYAYTYLFTRLRKQLKKTPLIYEIAVDMLCDMISHKGSGYRSIADKHLLAGVDKRVMTAQTLVDTTLQNLTDDESYQ